MRAVRRADPERGPVGRRWSIPRPGGDAGGPARPRRSGPFPRPGARRLLRAAWLAAGGGKDGRVGWIVGNAVVALAYLAGAALGMSLLFDRWSATLWPSSGIALAGVLLGGARLAPGVAVGSLIVNGAELVRRDASVAGAFLTASWIALGNVLQAVAGARLLDRIAPPHRLFEQTGSVLGFVLAAPVASSAVSATLASAALVGAGHVAAGNGAEMWVHWWLGNAMGILVVTPLVIAWWAYDGVRSWPRRPVESALLFATLAVVSAVVFGWERTTDIGNYPLVYLPMPILGWAALRTGIRGTVAANALLVTVAITSTVRGRGPFVQGTPEESLLLLQAFGGFVGITTLLLAAVVFEREQGARALRRAAEHLEERVAARTRELRGLSARLRSIREEERRHIAAELHDELGQALTALNIDVAWVAKNLPDGVSALHERARTMRRSIDGIIRSVRRIASDLRPSVLDNLGLLDALAWQLGEFESRFEIACTASIGVEELDVDPARSMDVFRAVQEALTNVARHAQASAVHLDVQLRDGRLVVEITDDGRGIPAAAVTDAASVGLVGMRERIGRWHGTVEIAGLAGRGTIVRLTCPLGGTGRPGAKEER